MGDFSREQLICIAQNLKAFHENAMNHEIADWAGSCRDCELLGSKICGQGNILVDASGILWDKTGTGICWCNSSQKK